MIVNDGCDRSLLSVKESSSIFTLPPGGDRAAAGGTTGRRRTNSVARSTRRVPTTFVITYLGGAEGFCRVEANGRHRVLSGVTLLAELFVLMWTFPSDDEDQGKRFR